MSNTCDYDVIVVGGGAAGMMAAGRAAERGRSVLLLEKNRELGKKLSITGGGRCNIFNAEADQRALLAQYGEAMKFLFSPMAQHGMHESWQFFERRGLPIVVEARKRAFPRSQSAPDVTRCLRRYLETSGRVTVLTGSAVQSIPTDENGQVSGVRTKQGTYTAESYVLATGGASHPETGSTGESFRWLQAIGHTVHAPNPTLVPLTVRERWVHDLSGTSLSHARVTFGTDRSTADGRFSIVGKVLFTHFGLSGPRILNAASSVQPLLEGGDVSATIDMYPDTEVGTVRNRIYELFEQRKNKTFRNILKECVPRGMDGAIAAHLPADMLEQKVHSITRERRHLLADLLKGLPLTVTGTKGMDWAVISDGGVDLREVYTRTMQSRLYPNLYLTGDVLHINRPSGGYSLQLCWTTGWVAGQHA